MSDKVKQRQTIVYCLSTTQAEYHRLAFQESSTQIPLGKSSIVYRQSSINRLSIVNPSSMSYQCTACSHSALKWAGKCPSCGAWNTLVETELPIKK
jgi:lipopolysaccharide biosynthesis regulator YciM